MGKKNKGNRGGVVYSTDPNYSQEDEWEEEETLDPSEQSLVVYHDSRQRKGKTVTIVDGFTGTEDDLKDLAKMLKSFCGVGGSAKDGQILIQGEVKVKVGQKLEKEGYGFKVR